VNDLEALADRLLAEQHKRGTYFHFNVVLDGCLEIVVEPVNGGEGVYVVGQEGHRLGLRVPPAEGFTPMTPEDIVAMFFPAAIVSVH
jgi:hypothetical protein